MNDSGALAKAAVSTGLDAVSKAVGALAAYTVITVGIGTVWVATGVGLYVLGRRVFRWLNTEENDSQVAS